MTAEFAAVVPAVVLVLAGCLACVQVVGQQVRLQDAAAAVSRSIARGDDPGRGMALAQRAAGPASVATSHSGDLVCAHLRARSTAPLGAILGLTLTASSCSLGGGR